jgi:KRAB domain-containing zinc finger protein
LHEKKAHGIVHPNIHDVDENICPICLKRFKNKTSVLAHITQHGEEVDGEFACDICHKIFPRKKLLECHMQDVHVERAFSCPTCLKSFKHEKHLKEHMNSHSKPYECSICGGRFANERYLKKHELMHQEGLIKEKSYMCPHCSEVFPTATNFRIHAKEEHSDMPDHTNVPIRGGSKPVAAVKQRKSKVRPGNYNCEICKRTYELETSLTAHELKKHVNDENRLSCDICNVKFITPRTLKKHCYEEHSIGEEIPCRSCDRIFYNKEDLDHHFRVVHEKEVTNKQSKDELHICVLCHKYFLDIESLVVHECSHKKKELICRFCSDKFRSFKTLKQHIFDCNKERCVYCDEEFNSKQERDAHSKQHSTFDLICKCDYCPEIFVDKELYLEHKKCHEIDCNIKCEPEDIPIKSVGKRLFQTLAPVTTVVIKKELNDTDSDGNFKSLLLSFSK